MGRILFIRGGAVGDFILTMPSLRLVREQLPDNEIEVLGYPAITALATAVGLADATRSIEDARLAPFFAPGAKLDPEWCDYLAGFDVVVSYLYDPDRFFAGNLERAGVKMLLEGPFRPSEEPPQLPAAVQLAKPLERIALFLEDPELRLEYHREIASPLPHDGAATRVILHPGSGSPSKNWSFESWVEVLSQLQDKGAADEFVITCGEAEQERIEDFQKLAEDAALSCRYLTGQSLPELGALFSESAEGSSDERRSFFLGHDSGISHLAASAGASGLLLFGPTESKVWSPVSSTLKPILSSNGSMGGFSVAEVLGEIESWSSSHPSRRE
jgi:ADP-heptose:LPS heptosyltransferase